MGVGPLMYGAGNKMDIQNILLEHPPERVSFLLLLLPSLLQLACLALGEASRKGNGLGVFVAVTCPRCVSEVGRSN